MMIIELLKELYKTHYLGENEVVLTISLTQPRAGEFFSTFSEIIPSELKTELVYEFVDKSDGIIVKGTKERIKELDDYLTQMKESIAKQEINGILVSESFTGYLRKGIDINEGWSNLGSYNIYQCMRCGKVELFGPGNFPLTRPYMCPLCGSYMFQRQTASY